MKRLFHVSLAKNVCSIMTQGLLTSQRFGMSSRAGDAQNHIGFSPIFLTSDVQRLVDEQIGTTYANRHHMFVFQIDVTNQMILDERRFFKCGSVDFSRPPWTFVTLESIKPSNITCIGDLLDHVYTH